MALHHVIRSIRNRRTDRSMNINNYRVVSCCDDDSDTLNIDNIISTTNTDDGHSAGSDENETDDESKLSLNAFETLPDTTPYDVVIRINSLAALKTSGWEIVLGENAKTIDSPVSKSDDGRGVIVAVLGSYNRGKSFLINQLCNINLRSGNLIHTEGLSMTAGRNQAENIIFIDTAGTDTAIPKDQLSDKKATEALLKEIALQLCSHVIIVVNRLRATDQSYIRQVTTHCRSVHESNSKSKSVIIIHNLSDVEMVDDMDRIIESEVKGLFKAKPETMNLPIDGGYKTVRFYTSIEEEIEIRHFIFAKHSSEAAKTVNQQSIDSIMSILQTATDNRRNLDIIPEIIKYVNNRLPQIFNNNCEEDSSDGNKKQKFQVQIHTKKPFIVLSRRTDLEDLDQCPDEMELSPKLLYDDAGYFIGISAAYTGQWTPRYSVYAIPEEIHIIIELAGVKKGDLTLKKDAVHFELLEEAIIIRGNRSDFKESLSHPTILQEKIPTGQFILEIPLNFRVELDDARLEIHDGLYKIICPKKKLKSKVF